jgi:hypothetical protein
MTHELSDPNPIERADKYLHDHPIHGCPTLDPQDLVVKDGFDFPFLPYHLAPAHFWPINAADWGLMEITPFIGLYKPKPNDNTTDHPAGEDMMECGVEAYPAFLYR